MAKRVNAPLVLDQLSKRQLGKVIQRTLRREGEDASKRRLGKRFQKEARKKLGWVRVHDKAVR